MFEQNNSNDWILCKDQLPDLEPVSTFWNAEYCESKPCIVFGDVDYLGKEHVWIAHDLK